MISYKITVFTFPLLNDPPLVLHLSVNFRTSYIFIIIITIIRIGIEPVVSICCCLSLDVLKAIHM